MDIIFVVCRIIMNSVIFCSSGSLIVDNRSIVFLESSEQSGCGRLETTSALVFADWESALSLAAASAAADNNDDDDDVDDDSNATRTCAQACGPQFGWCRILRTPCLPRLYDSRRTRPRMATHRHRPPLSDSFRHLKTEGCINDSCDS